MKNLFKYSSMALVLCLGLLVSSCSDESNNPDPSTDKGSLTCQVNGSAWTGKSSTYNNRLNIDNVSGNQLIIDAKDDNDVRIVLTANGDKPGTYVLDVGNSKFDAGASLQLVENGQQVIATSVDVSVTITSLDQGTQKASGSFRFTSDDNKYKVTSGTFTNLHFEIK